MFDRKEYIKKAAGAVIPLNIPFSADEKVDYESLRKYVQFLVQNGARTLLLTSGSSEYGLLCDDEIFEITRVTAETVAGRCNFVGASKFWSVEKTAEYIDFAKKHGITKPVWIAAQAMTTDYPSAFEDSMIKMIGYDMAKACAKKVYDQAGLGPKDVQVIELHDCFTSNEIVTYEALGLCDEGQAEKFIWDGDNTYGGKWVTNPSGGLLSKGHPLGATGLAQCTELVWQLRGTAGKRQVPNAKVALQHNLGLGGACVMTMYRAD